MKTAGLFCRTAVVAFCSLAAAGTVLAQAASAQTGAAAGAASASSSAPPNMAGNLPAEVFFGPADIVSTALSPSGRWLAIATGKGGERVGLYVFDLQAWKPLAVVARFVDGDIRSFQWVNDERLVFDITDKTLGGGEQRWAPGLFSATREGKEMRGLVRLNRASVSAPTMGREMLEPNHVLLHVPSSDGDDVIVGEIKGNNFNEFETLVAKRLNTRTGRATSLSYGAPAHVRRFLFDPAGEPRVAVTQHAGRGAVHWRAPGKEAWERLAEYDIFKIPFSPAFIDDQGTLYVSQSSGKGGTSELKRFDFATGKPEAKALVTTQGFDVQGSLISETVGNRILGVRLVTDAETTVWYDKGMAALQAQADQRFPGRVNRLSCRRCSADDRVTVVLSYSDQDPGQVWVHQAGPNTWRKVGDLRANTKPTQMATVDFQRVRARDGMEIPVWVTTPNEATVGAAPQKRPAVVLVHGGPWVRGGHWNWHPMAQFLASRGYVVIEPEFRGSTGFGDAHYRAGWKQWGQAMQDDVADATAWAVKEGLVDGKRVCIAGGSYGGYAALMGLARHPEMYRCGAAWVAVTDPRLLLKWRSDSDGDTEGREFLFPTMIGDPEKDAVMLDSVSPVLLADRIKAPLFMAFGGGDRRVPLVHGKRMRQALIDVGRPPTWVVYEEEGHGWRKLENNLDFAKRLEEFLATHLK
jgi:dipeptidyl aminopeptidase/acylaminoacyl peptidase